MVVEIRLSRIISFNTEFHNMHFSECPSIVLVGVSVRISDRKNLSTPLSKTLPFGTRARSEDVYRCSFITSDRELLLEEELTVKVSCTQNLCLLNWAVVFEHVLQ
jgi:hypothetical protein